MRQTENGEGLYKSSLTRANFGLLGVRFYESVAGRKRWNIRSRFAEMHRKENYAFLEEVNADFFAEKTGNVVVTRSDYGRSLIDKNMVDLEGNVVIRSKRGYRFNMEKLRYHGEDHHFTSEDPVQMKGPDVERPTMILRGTGLWADVDNEHFKLKRNVAAQKKMSTKEWIKINSRMGEFFTEEQHAIFTGKAHAILPTAEIDSDVFEIAITNDRESLTANGNVRLVNRDRIGRAESAFLEVGTGKIVLEGKAQIDSKGNLIEGRRITLYTDDDRIEVEGAEGKVEQ